MGSCMAGFLGRELSAVLWGCLGRGSFTTNLAVLYNWCLV